MVIPENLTNFIKQVTGKYSDRVHFITPLYNQYPIEIHDWASYGLHGTEMFYSPYNGFGKYRIGKPFVNIGIIPLHKNEIFNLATEYESMNMAKDIEITTFAPHRLTKLIPYIIVNGIKCYYDNIRNTFGYDKNNVITYSEAIGTMKAMYDIMRRNNYTHYAVIYFSPKHYIQ